MSTAVLEPVEQLALPDFKLTGKTAFVTGGSRGIGKAIALVLANAGADVAISCNTGSLKAQEVREAIRQMGRKAEFYAHDLAEPQEVEKMQQEIARDFPQVDILVNNAGITRDRSFKKMTKDLWDAVMRVNLDSVFLVTKLFIDSMADRGWGRVINISSVIGEHGNFGQSNYAAAKAGIIGFTKSLAREYARKNVTVNAVAPGFIDTDMMKDIPKEAMDAILNLIPVKRLGRPLEVAGGVLFLASQSAAYVTGQVLDINGGMAM